jgi:hypothetical protein
MSDYNSGLPIRSESDGADEKVIVKIVDGQPGGSNQMQIDADKNAHVEMHGNAPDGATDKTMRLSESGHPNGNGDYHASENSDPASAAVILHDRVATPGKADQNFRPTGVASTDGSNAKAQDVALRDESGNAFTTDNPLPVTFTDSEGDEVNDYDTAAAVAATASDNHDYTVTALKRLKLSQVAFAGSGRLKVEVQVESGVGTDVFATKFVAFNSTAAPSGAIPINENITVDAGVRVRVIRTNRDNQAQDVYTTICGHEID